MSIIATCVVCGVTIKIPPAENQITKKHLNLLSGVSNTKIVNLGQYKNLSYNDSTADETGLFEVSNTFYLLKDIINCSEFYIDSEEIANFSVEIVNDYNEMAYFYDMELDEYYKDVLKLDKDEFFDYCYDSGLYDVEKVLVIGAIAGCEDIAVNRSEVNSYLKEHNSTIEEYKSDRKQKAYVDYQILEEKVTDFLRENNHINNNNQ